MAQISEGGDNDTNVDLNLVPFIDLMSVMITFLLVTAVWTQVSMIQLGTSIYGRQSDGQPTPTPPKKDIVLRVDVKETGFNILYGTRNIPVQKTQDGEYDVNGLFEELKKIKIEQPEKEDAFITVQNDLSYEALIKGMDQILAAGFPQISVAASGVE